MEFISFYSKLVRLKGHYSQNAYRSKRSFYSKLVRLKGFAQPALILYYILILFVKFIFIFSFSRQIFVDRR